MPTTPDYMKKIILQGIKDRDRYDRILQQLKNNTQSPPIKKEIPVMKKSRIWKKFSMKVLTNIVIPTVVLFAILAFAIAFSVVLIYFGMSEKVATLVGPGIAILGPFLFSMLYRFYKDSVDEVATENKKLMKDLKGNY